MPIYRFHELIISSQIELPELIEIRQSAEPRCEIHFEVVGVSDLQVLDDGAAVDQLATADGHGTIVSFGSGVEFVIPRTADHVVVRHLGDADVATMRHLLLDHALPRLLATQGQFAAHASGVARAGQSIIFLGVSGSGKSSMAAGLHRAGNPLLGDDCFTLMPSDEQTVTALSTYRSLRLLPESIDQFYPDGEGIELSPMGVGSDKVRVIERGMTHPVPMPVAGIFLLAKPEHVGRPRVELLSGRDGLVALARNSFRLNTSHGPSLRIALDQAEAIVRRVPIAVLQFERSFDDLEHLHQVIFDSIS